MLSDLQTQLDKAVSHLKHEFAMVHVGRANAAMVDEINVHVASYGSDMPLKSTANISCPDPQTIRVEPWDKGILGDIERSIREADIGINPQNMGDYILLPVPPMTEERRHQVVKRIHEEAEKARISVRNIRHDFMRKVKAQKDEKEISEDEANKLEKQMQEKVDTGNKTIGEVTKAKETDVMSV